MAGKILFIISLKQLNKNNYIYDSQKNRVALSVTIGISVVLLLGSSFWIYSRNSRRIKSEEDDEDSNNHNSKVSYGNDDSCPALTPSEVKSAVVADAEVVDVDYEDEEDEEEAKMAELKTKYDDAVRMASKLIQGNANKRAIEKLTEALELGDKYISKQMYHRITKSCRTVSYRQFYLTIP